ncbi:MAG: hypothetical protein K2G90_08785 [Muribaculaceae bacterium]|nr:hypothetical protein [Muribaculaceae bacterium]
MEEQENDNIYIYSESENDEDGKPIDDSGPNYAQVDPAVVNNGHIENKAGARIDSPNLFLLLFKVMLNPIEGWKSIRRSKVTAEELQRGCFSPLLGLLAISQFVELFFSSRITLANAIEDAVISFVSFFMGYFCIILLLRAIMPKVTTKSLDSDFGKIFVLVNLSTLCIFYSLTELLPMLWAILIFLPLWTVYIICRGTRFFVFPNNRQITCTATLCLVIIGIPTLLDWILEQILPKIS